MNNQPIKRRRESHSGNHFFTLYQLCARKFEFKYLHRLSPMYQGPALIFGSAFHEAKAVFYNTKSKSKAMFTATNEIIKARTYFEREEDYEKCLYRAPVLIASWIEKFGYSDLDTYNILGVELPIELPIPKTNFKMTMRLDALVQDKDDGYVYVLESKTSGTSINLTEMGVYYGDQATAYLWGAKEAGEKLGYKAKDVLGVLPDISYWHKNAKSEDNISHVRPDIVYRNDEQLLEYQESVAGILTDITQRVNAYEKKLHSPRMLFPRSTYYCNAFFKPCEYADICRHKVARSGRAPHGFKRDRKDYRYYRLTGEV